MKTKGSEHPTGIMIGDIFVINPKKQTLKVKRGTEFLDFECFEYTDEKFVSKRNGDYLCAEYNEHYNVWDFLSMIRSFAGLNVEQITDDPSIEPGEQFWVVKEY